MQPRQQPGREGGLILRLAPQETLRDGAVSIPQAPMKLRTGEDFEVIGTIERIELV